MADATCANPLLLGWVKEWLDQARERSSKGANVYKKAYDSMKACPLTFNHPSEAQQLHGFGPKLCDRLTTKLKDYCAENGLPMPEPPHKATKRRGTNNGEDPTESQPAKKARKTKQYVPALRSGPYGLLLGLASLDEDAPIGLTKSELIELAQPHCDSSYTAPIDTSKFYTAWNSMKTLVQKEFVYEHGRPQRRYLLTEEGWEIAKGIKKTASLGESNVGQDSSDKPLAQERTAPTRRPLSPGRSSAPPPSGISQPRSRDLSSRHRLADFDDPDFLTIDSSPPAPVRPSRDNDASFFPEPRSQNDHTSLAALPFTPITLPPNSFTVELVLDNREVRAVRDRDYIANELSKKGITPIIRSLELGDALWVAKCKDSTFLARNGEEGDEVMLDWILERKRLDDLVGSIKDGRFHEQKFRLRRSGIQNVIYLIEEFSVTDSVTASGMRYQDAVASAIASTQVVNGYFVKKTTNLDDTIRYLVRMTSLLQSMYTPNQTTTTTTTTATSSSNTPHPRLSLIPSRHITSLQAYLQLLTQLRANSNPSTTIYTTTFATFSTLSSKSDMLSLRDVFLKMLMCTRGVTGDKALEIQRRWPTPREFVEAFEQFERGGSGGAGSSNAALDDMVFSQLGGLVGRKKVGKVLSKNIAEVWGQEGDG
ncbi:hypothetical protein AJ80_08230 [Polytolypa hystricis UAMH7299]|uniref:Crossover junction endonuclease MUS81 n=1 Tax=Polytolypa hystricis (strain UAMH7299) TaxID=1447883 RepID=A0A2B7XBF4_POLH7|nr:hypothetical protein AJ80_08230 [Polytolypa hystricis UAMH7299]